MSTSQEHVNPMGSEPSQAATGQASPPPMPGNVPPAWGGRWPDGPRGKSPVLAGILSSMMPGLGQIYLGYYQRGFVHAGVFASIVACLASGSARGLEPLFGIMLGFFYFYNIVDAVRRASLYNLALRGVTQIPMPEDFKMPSGRSSLMGGVLLTGLGLILLLNTRFDLDLDWVADWWPAVIVLVGASIVYRALKERKSS